MSIPANPKQSSATGTVTPFGASFSASTGKLWINPNSTIMTNGSVYSSLAIQNLTDTFDFTGGTFLYIKVSFDSGAPSSASLVASKNGWWDSFPESRFYKNGEAKKIENQLSLYVPVATVCKLKTNKQVFGHYIVTQINDVKVEYVYQQHIHHDLILFQGCDGFFFLPAPASCPAITSISTA